MPEESIQAAPDKDSRSPEDQPQAITHQDTSSQCDLQVMSDSTGDAASITAESVSSTEYKLRSRPKTAPNHFRTQTAPPRLQRPNKPAKAVRPSKPTQQQKQQQQKQEEEDSFVENISDISSESSSLDRAYTYRITSQVSHDAPGYYEYHRPYSVYRKPLRRPLSLPNAFDDSPKLHHPGLDPGQREYLWHTASVYSVGNMKQLAQRRYKQKVDHQIAIGFHTREECEKYYKYITRTRKRQYEADTSVWRSPPKQTVRPKHFPRRYRSQGEVEETRRVNQGYYRGQSSKGKGSPRKESDGNLNNSMERLSLVYSPDHKRTLVRKRTESAD